MQAAGILLAYLNSRKSNAAREEIKAQVCEVRDRVETIRTTKDEVQTMIAGAERRNVSRGIEIGKQQATGPAELSGK